jgi:hypothetical protein
MFQSGLINTFYYDRFLGVRIYARWPFVCRSGSHSCRCLWTLFTELPRRGLLGNSSTQRFAVQLIHRSVWHHSAAGAGGFVGKRSVHQRRGWANSSANRYRQSEGPRLLPGAS